MKPLRILILILAVNACTQFDPERDSDLADLHSDVYSQDAFDGFPESVFSGAAMKLTALVYNADTLVVSKIAMVNPYDSHSFLFPRMKRDKTYTIKVFGSMVTGEDTQHTNVWSILPQKRLLHLRAERVIHSFGALDWLGTDVVTTERIAHESYQLSLRPMGQPCRLTINDWQETDSYTVSLKDKTVIKIGEEAKDDKISALKPLLQAGNPMWLCVFNTSAVNSITVIRERDGEEKSATKKVEMDGEIWSTELDF